jgi:hypothetical protein
MCTWHVPKHFAWQVQFRIPEAYFVTQNHSWASRHMALPMKTAMAKKVLKSKKVMKAKAREMAQLLICTVTVLRATAVSEQ